MKRFLKWLLGILFFLVIILIGTALALPYLIDPNEYKADIIAQIKPHMKGRDLKIPGDIKLSVFPWLGAEVGEMVIGNAEGFILKPFMTIKYSKVQIRLLSLFSDQPEIGSLEFKDININLQQDAEGRNNWSDLTKEELAVLNQPGLIKVANSTNSANSTKAANKANDGGKSEFKIPNLKITGLHFHNVKIQLDDKKAKDVLTLSKLNIDAGPINNLNPIPVKGKFNFHSKKQEVAAAAAFASALTITEQLDDFNFKKFVLNTNISGNAVGNKVIKTSLRVPELHIQTALEKIKAKPLTLKIDDMSGEGRLTIKRFTKPVIRLGLDMKKLDLNKIIPKTSATKPEPAQQQTKPQPGSEDYIPTVDDILEGKDKVDVIDESAKLFAPLAVFGGTDTQGTINIGQLLVKNLELKDVKINLVARSGLVSALPTAKLYGGTYEGDIQINTKRKPARLTSRQKFKNISMGPVTLALTGKETLTGRANFQGQFYSAGDTQNAITENLSGDGQFSVREAKIKTLDIKQLILKENYEKLEFAKEKHEDKKVTVFKTMRGTLRVKEGVAYNKDFSAIARRIHLKGQGYTSLVDETVKYTVTAIPKKPFGFNLAGRRYDLKNKNIRTHFTGPWSQIEIDNDLEEVLKAEFKQSELYKEKRAKEEEVKEFIKEETDKLKEKFKDKL